MYVDPYAEARVLHREAAAPVASPFTVKKIAQLYSPLGTLLLLIGIAVFSNGLVPTFGEIKIFMTGGVASLPRIENDFLSMLQTTTAVVSIDLVMMLTLLLLVHGLVGKAKQAHALDERFRTMQTGHHFMASVALVVVEEVIARWLFLGVLTQVFTSTTAFYVLLVAGNGLWAASHLPNYSGREDRQLIRVLPIFLSGFLLSYLFVRYGLLASIAAHLASNMVVYAGDRKNPALFTPWMLTTIVYSSVCAVIGYLLLPATLAPLGQWFTGAAITPVPGWTLSNYLGLYLLVSSGIAVVLNLLGYEDDPAESSTSIFYDLFVSLIGSVVTVGMVYVAFWISGWFVDSVPYRLLWAALCICCLVQNHSGNTIATTFWQAVTELFLLIALIQAQGGFWAGVVFIAIATSISLPYKAVKRFMVMAK